MFKLLSNSYFISRIFFSKSNSTGCFSNSFRNNIPNIEIALLRLPKPISLVCRRHDKQGTYFFQCWANKVVDSNGASFLVASILKWVMFNHWFLHLVFFTESMNRGQTYTYWWWIIWHVTLLQRRKFVCGVCVCMLTNPLTPELVNRFDWNSEWR